MQRAQACIFPEVRAEICGHGLRVAAQGVVCASAFIRRGIQVDCIPPHASMGAMVLEIARALSPIQVEQRRDRPEIVALYFAERFVKPA